MNLTAEQPDAHDRVFPDENLPADTVVDCALLATDVDDEDVGSAEALALAPGRSWATTAPMITVVPVLARIAPRVSVRSRARALSLSVGVVGWDRSGM
jgi:hypothetical protein